MEWEIVIFYSAVIHVFASIAISLTIRMSVRISVS
jgi:hypothetical protein